MVVKTAIPWGVLAKLRSKKKNEKRVKACRQDLCDISNELT